MGRAFSVELDHMEHTLMWSTSVDLPPAASVLMKASDLYVVIGSGGSFTTATALASIKSEAHHGIALAMTPLQYVQRAETLPPHEVLLISAEGKNRDILHAARKALAIANGCSALTFSRASPLTVIIDEVDPARVFYFDPPWEKDGYLATNSLLASVILGFRILGLNVDARILPAFLHFYRTTDRLDQLVSQIARTRKLLALHGNHGLVAAVDLESKLSEAAFAFTQIADLRQFAHGRHIQLDKGDEAAPVIAFISSHEEALWHASRMAIPSEVVVTECALPADSATAAVSGLLIVMALVEKVATILRQDPGQPVVPEFARRIHALDTAKLLPIRSSTGTNPKLAALGALAGRNAAIQAGARYIERLKSARFSGLVLDFDGTMCETSRREQGLDERLTPIVTNLLQNGLTIAFASGRGDSLHENLRNRLPPETWSQCVLGCYSGSLILSLAHQWPSNPTDPQVANFQTQLESLGVRPENGFKLSSRAAQLTIRPVKKDGVDPLFTLCSSLVSGHQGWRVFRSAHSVDVLAPTAAKNAVVLALAEKLEVDPLAEVCRIGDRGEPSGNDSELLAEGLGLSVDGVSNDPDACWLFGEPTLGPVERTANYLGSLIMREGKARFDERVLERWQKQLV